MRPSKLLLLLSAGLLLSPVTVMAQESNEPEHSPEVHALPSSTPHVEAGQFCIQFSEATRSVSGDTTDHFTKLQDNFNQRADKVKSGFNAATTKIAGERKHNDDQLSANFGKLDAKAATDTQKAAVATFKASVTQAVTTRRTAVDAANKAFQQGVQASVTGRQAQLKTAAATYKTAVSAALANAKSSCAAGVAPATVRTNLQTALAKARTNLENARKNAEKVGSSLDALKATRKAAVEKANADFKTAMKGALDQLKATLGVKASSPEPSPES
jgi:hypothetical protein